MDEVNRAIQAAIQALEKRDRTRSELERKLADLGFPEHIRAAAIERVVARGFLNEERIAQLESGRAATGPNRLRARLEKRGIDDDLIESTVGAMSDDAQLASMRELLAKRAFKDGERARAGRALFSRGFEEALIQQVLDERYGDATHD